jgi:hypothetical protein
VTKRETNLVVATAVVAIASLLTAVAAVTAALVVGRPDHAKIRTLEHQVTLLCSRTVVSGVALSPAGKARVTTARGC